MVHLAGKVVIITGASSGFGAEAAKLFAKEGCKVVLCARRLDRLEELAKEIRSAGGEALPVEMNVTQLEQIQAMVQKTIDVYSRIDILFETTLVLDTRLVGGARLHQRYSRTNQRGFN
ncbi:MAG: SDR family NAD(P)-dependent oxidoreductase [Anaerolineales bacterium]